MIKKIDHLVITAAKPEECLRFYEMLGFKAKVADGRYELFAGDFKINVHIKGKELSPHATNVMPGSCDLCFEIDSDIEKFKEELINKGIEIHLGVVAKSGVKGEMRSFYLYDPEGNLLEFCSYK